MKLPIAVTIELVGGKRDGEAAGEATLLLPKEGFKLTDTANREGTDVRPALEVQHVRQNEIKILIRMYDYDPQKA